VSLILDLIVISRERIALAARDSNVGFGAFGGFGFLRDSLLFSCGLHFQNITLFHLLTVLWNRRKWLVVISPIFVGADFQMRVKIQL
jgi:hypothetical protein